MLSPIEKAIQEMPAVLAAANRRARRAETRRFVETYDAARWRPRALLGECFDPDQARSVNAAARETVIGALRRAIRHHRELCRKRRWYADSLALQAARKVYVAERAATCRFATRVLKHARAA